MSEIASLPMTSSDWTELDMTFLPRPETGSAGTLLIEVTPLDELDTGTRPMKPADGVAVPRLCFPSYALLHKILAPNRLAVIQALTGIGPVSIRELSRRLGRDFKGVHTDVAALLDAGLLYKTEDGRIVFPFDAIRFDFTLSGPARSAA
jgi:predicted transcriptional regulator